VKGPFSHSRLSSFEDCPKKFHFRYVERIPAPSESIEGFVGKRVHEVLERLYRAAAEDRVPSLARVLHRYNALFDEAYDPERVRIVRSGTEIDFYREYGERCLSNYYRGHYPFDADETLGLEERIQFSLNGESDYRILGFIDRLVRARDGAIEIHDFKTSRRIPRQERLDGDRQLALYQMGVAERFDADAPIRLVWHYLHQGAVRTSARAAGALEALRVSTIALIDRIRATRDFPPKTGPLCDWCEYRDRCPAFAPQSAPTDDPPPDRTQLSLI
jgi:putative RecB family exonuclease